MTQARTRRAFLRAAPLAAAALPLADTLTLAAAAQSTLPADAGPAPGVQYISAQSLQSSLQELQEAPGNRDLITSKALEISATLTVEEKKAAKEFEAHDHRDHIFQILDGTTRYELGGTLVKPRQTKPGEWLAATSEGFTVTTVSKGDLLMIPRGTPHRRITDEKVSFLLISASHLA